MMSWSKEIQKMRTKANKIYVSKRLLQAISKTSGLNDPQQSHYLQKVKKWWTFPGEVDLPKLLKSTIMTPPGDHKTPEQLCAAGLSFLSLGHCSCFFLKRETGKNLLTDNKGHLRVAKKKTIWLSTRLLEKYYACWWNKSERLWMVSISLYLVQN